MRQIIPLILQYNGTLSAQNGDGMIRGPWLPAQFSHEVYAIFKEVKELFDPLYIFNPYKKTDASLEYNTAHLRGKRTP
jgi:FAD/FMN-containing dehydrogenase